MVILKHTIYVPGTLQHFRWHTNADNGLCKVVGGGAGGGGDGVEVVEEQVVLD